MASSSGISSGSTGSGEPVVIDQRKQKRMLSNRESARRSRLRKQQHLDGLIDQVAQLRKENNQISTSINITTQHYVNVESENSVLRAQMGELTNRLQSLNEIINYMNGNNAGFQSDHQEPPESKFESFYSGFMSNDSPWNYGYMNQPIVASADMF